MPLSETLKCQDNKLQCVDQKTVQGLMLSGVVCTDRLLGDLLGSFDFAWWLNEVQALNASM